MARLFLAAVLSLFVGVSSVLAASSLTGRASNNDRLTIDFTTTTAGDIVGTATFTPKGTTVYNLFVDTAADLDHYCAVHFDNRVAKTTVEQTISCTVPNAPAGDYQVIFYPGSGWVNATISAAY